MFFFLSRAAFADDIDTALERCKSDSQKEFCVGKVLVALVRAQVQPVGGSSGVSPAGYCQCRTETHVGGGATVTLKWVRDTGLPLTLAENLNPKDCIESLRFPPCRASRSAEDGE